MKSTFTTLLSMLSFCAYAQINNNVATEKQTVLLQKSIQEITLPYAYGFETEDLDGWTTINNGTGKIWERVKFTGPQVGPSEGEYYMRYNYSSTDPANTWMFSRPIKLTAGQKIKISYDHRTAGKSAGMSESYKLTIGKGATIADQTTILLQKDKFFTADNKYETVEVEYTATETSEYNLGFHCYSDKFMWTLMIDNIKIESSSLSIGELNKVENKVYPNPTSDFINFSTKSIIKEVKIFDLTGKQLLYIREASLGKIDVQGLKEGVYIVQANIEGVQINRKFIKK
ncbi:choice-of-anchor J domain-containing protein [Empedobacter tilapiae]